MRTSFPFNPTHSVVSPILSQPAPSVPSCLEIICSYGVDSRSSEDFSYFTLRREGTEDSPATSLFGISCTRQLDASLLHNRPADVTRSTVQKAIVVISDSPQHFGVIKAKLGAVTEAWFLQR